MSDVDERDYYGDLLGKGKGDPDFYPAPDSPMWVNGDRATLERSTGDVHWSDLPKPVTERKEYELGDQMADHSDDQDYEPMEREET